MIEHKFQSKSSTQAMSRIESIVNQTYFDDDEIRDFIVSCFIPKIGPFKQMKRNLLTNSIRSFIHSIDERVKNDCFDSEFINDSVRIKHSYQYPMNRLINIMMNIEKKTETAKKPFDVIGSLCKRITLYDYISKLITATSISITVSCIKESLIEYYIALALGKTENESLELLETHFKHLFLKKIFNTILL